MSGQARNLRVVPNEPEAAKAQLYDENYERCIIGAMILAPTVIGEVRTRCKAEDFYRPAHAAMFAAILTAADEGIPVDQHTMARRFSEVGIVQRLRGGADYISECTSAVPITASAGYYAREVAELAQRRRFAEEVNRAALAVTSPAVTKEQLAALGERLREAATPRFADDETGRLAEVAASTFDRLDARANGTGCISTGLPDLDRYLNGGLRRGRLHLPAGRPGMGKSVLAAGMARHAAVRLGKTVAYFSREMPTDEVFDRMISAEGSVPWNVMDTGKYDAEQAVRIARAIATLEESPLYIFDAKGKSPAEIAAVCRRIEDLSVVVVDYLQLLDSDEPSESQRVELDKITRALKLLAIEQSVAVVAVAQLNRGPEQRSDRRPIMADLRGSGSLEADADVVMLLHREDYYDKESPRAGEIDIDIPKNRGGATGSLTAAAQLHMMRIVSMATTDPNGGD